MKKKAAFLDRDGVINTRPAEGDYITRLEEMNLLPGTAEAIRLFNESNFQVVVVTNQRCVAKGLITSADLEAIHRQMIASLARDGAIVDAIYYCPHEADPPCDCRKPKPGMIFTAASEHLLDLPASWMIGDSEADIKAGTSAGCKTALIVPNGKSEVPQADVVATSLLEAAQQILDQT